jgi:hypothetical protein
MLLNRMAAAAAFWHAGRVFRTFDRATADAQAAQQFALTRALRTTRGSAFARTHRLATVHTPPDLRRALPLHTFEDYRPTIDRVADGDVTALLAPDQRPLMFATSSGTTARQKLIPVTPNFVVDYRRGWNTFGLKLLRDHPAAILRFILQVTGRVEESRTAAGIPVGAITGLLARTQKRIVRRFYVGGPAVADITDPECRYYTLMRLAASKDLAFAITANPATLIRLAQVADQHRTALVRDVHDGTISPDFVPEPTLRRVLSAGLRPDPGRAAALAEAVTQHGSLRPRDIWQVTFLACWTGGSLGHYLGRLADWWGPIPVRDIGLLASEGRVSLPLEDATPAGVLDVTAGLFEFIPLDNVEAPQPETLFAHELSVGERYSVVLSNTTGLLRYRLDDVVEVTGFRGPTPIVRFLHRAGRVSSLAGEKLTEHQVVEAFRATCAKTNLRAFDFQLVPTWGDPPHYRLIVGRQLPDAWADAFDEALADQNGEYASRRKSGRLAGCVVIETTPDAFAGLDQAVAARRGSTAEQYKRPCLITDPNHRDQVTAAS